MEQGSRYGPPVERKADGSLYEMTPSQQRQEAKMIQKYCCNCEKGNCILLDDGDERTCPQRISYTIGCRWFCNAVLPAFPELEAEIFKDITLRRCVKCGAEFVRENGDKLSALENRIHDMSAIKDIFDEKQKSMDGIAM